MHGPQFDDTNDRSKADSHRSARGAGLAEYGLLLLLILLACLIALGTLGTTLSAAYNTITTTLFP